MIHCYLQIDNFIFAENKNPLGAAARISSWLGLFVGPHCFSLFFWLGALRWWRPGRKKNKHGRCTLSPRLEGDEHFGRDVCILFTSLS